MVDRVQHSLDEALLRLTSLKEKGEKIACLTAYDASFARLLDQQSIDVILVGDSLGMVCQGEASTLSVSMDDMVYHSRCVAKGVERALLITDMPYQSYQTTAQAIDNAELLVGKGKAQMVKLEGACDEVIKALSESNIAVCAHLGLLPQSIETLGGYKVQGRDERSAQRIYQEALRVEQAGAKLLVLECVPSSLAEKISTQLHIPVIGIGAGPQCDGQILVLYDILNLDVGRKPRFVKDFMQGAGSIVEAVQAYRQAVKQGDYPAQQHCY